MAGKKPLGALLINVGTPDSPDPSAVGRYLRQFLMDPHILGLPWPLRWLLVNLLIVPRRSHLSAEAYAQIWTREGSPLLIHTVAQVQALSQALGSGWHVEAGMAVGNPSIELALARLRDRGCDEIVAVPLFPQHSTAAWDAAAEAATLAHRKVYGGTGVLKWVEPFHADPAFLDSWAEILRPHAREHVLFSFHGLPLSQIRAADPTGTCSGQGCSFQDSPANPRCYRAQCVATARGIASRLGLPSDRWSISFQSRLGRSQWIGPSTESLLEGLAKRGVARLVVACPSFVSDCLETLEEIGIRGKKTFQNAGGTDLVLVPCPNSSVTFAGGLARLVSQKQ
ncbi:MAG TPA: ferrochelatase [Bdellovibrionota bacterium]|jgi:ferrochelatase|nr:ferrochelatase [Bdellovibrionota bacterium]